MMPCPGCKQPALRITHTFTVHQGAQTRDYKCRNCGRMTSSVSYMLSEDVAVTYLVDGQKRGPKEERRAVGGRHLAQKLKKEMDNDRSD